jgi:outer membrane protein TolC
VISTEIQLERLSNRLSELEAERRASHAILVSFLTYAGIETVYPTSAIQRVPVNQDLEQWIATAHAMNPDLQRWALQIQRDLQKQRLADLQRYPDLQLGTQYGFMTAEDALSPVADGLDNLSFSVGLTLPVWKNKIDSGVREARADRTASSQSLQAEELTIDGNIEAILASIDALEQQRTRFSESILPRAEQAVEIGLSEYRVGKTTFVQMITNYRDRLEVQLEIIRLEAALAKRFAQLQRLSGSI